MFNIIVSKDDIKKEDNFLERYQEVNKYIMDNMILKEDKCQGMGSSVIIPKEYQIIGHDDRYNYVGNGINTYKISHIPEVSYHNGFITNYPLSGQAIIPEKEYVLTLACSLVDKGEPEKSTKVKDVITLARKGDYSLFNIDEETLSNFKEIKPYEYYQLMKNFLLRLFPDRIEKKLKSEQLIEYEYIKFIKEITTIMKIEKKQSEEDYKGLFLKY